LAPLRIARLSCLPEDATAVRYSPAIQDLVDRLRRLPGLGIRSAERIVFHLLACEPREVHLLAESLKNLAEKVNAGKQSGNRPDPHPCPICGDPSRDAAVLCVVEQPSDLYAIERTGQFRGQYHVLGGVLSPIAGVGSDQLRIGALVERARAGSVREL